MIAASMKSCIRKVVPEAEPLLREILNAQVASDATKEVAAPTRIPLPVFARWYAGNVGRRVAPEALELNACFVEPRATRICVFKYPETDVLTIVDRCLIGDLPAEIPHISLMTVVDAELES